MHRAAQLVPLRAQWLNIDIEFSLKQARGKWCGGVGCTHLEKMSWASFCPGLVKWKMYNFTATHSQLLRTGRRRRRGQDVAFNCELDTPFRFCWWQTLEGAISIYCAFDCDNSGVLICKDRSIGKLLIDFLIFKGSMCIEFTPNRARREDPVPCMDPCWPWGNVE